MENLRFGPASDSPTRSHGLTIGPGRLWIASIALDLQAQVYEGSST
jgi:hypothetical protein